MFSPNTDYKHLGSPNSPGTEPMTLGSPVSSPSSHSNSVSFLPSYLIRDVPSNSPVSSFTPQSGMSWNTPVKQSSPYISQLSPALSRKSLYQSPASSSLMGTPNVSKAGGPPVQGLFDSIASPISSHGMEFTRHVDHTPTIHHQSLGESQLHNGVLTPSKSFSHNTSSCMSPAQIDPFYTQGEALTSGSQLDESWVTVFGFPPAATSFVVQQFSQYGKIIEHKLATSGNWVHIRYQSKLQAKKALSKNGKIYGENIMVGVKPCIEMNLMADSGKENLEKDGTATFCQDSISAECFDSGKRSLKNIRPLTQIYKTPSSDTEVTPKSKIQPKANSLVSKAMDYVLNW